MTALLTSALNATDLNEFLVSRVNLCDLLDLQIEAWDAGKYEVALAARDLRA